MHRWLRGRSSEVFDLADLKDRPPVAKVIPHKPTPEERHIIIEASLEDEYADLGHRKLP